MTPKVHPTFTKNNQFEYNVTKTIYFKCHQTEIPFREG